MPGPSSEAVAHCVGGGGGACFDPEPGEEVGHMRLHRPGADGEDVGDLLV